MTTPASLHVCTHALTVRQPWVELILRGEKCVENRSWRLPASLVGVPLALHASRSAVDLRAGYGPLVGLAGDGRGLAPTVAERAALLFGAVVGVVTFARVDRWVDLDPVLRAHEASAHGVRWQQARGPYCWVVGDARRLPVPVVTRGRLGVWRLSHELRCRLARADAEAEGE